ncbi:TonB-dependent receptor [uncultured Helicobacter sp.]|uniref:TonB-dependent receptor n=1 Tax=uncultured Helicobacter sp. TaxID=175537 RepID=UPI0027DBEF8C|nr:TonB-dependent receptor [uncultured Helicobacter sp.]
MSFQAYRRVVYQIVAIVCVFGVMSVWADELYQTTDTNAESKKEQNPQMQNPKSEQDKKAEQNLKYDDIMLDNIVSVGTKVPSTIEQTPGNASIINQKQIKIRPNYRFTDTLRGEEGIIQPKGRGMETFDNVMVRGISNGALIMVDGVPLNDINNNTKMLTAMRAHELERVEIVRGPSSVLYGSGDLSGAVNFITKMPKELEVYGSVGYGNPFTNQNAPQNFTQWYLSAGDAFFDKQFRVKASYGGSFSNGYAADNAWVNTTGNGLDSGITGAIPSQNPQGTNILIVGDMGRQKFQTHDARIKLESDISENGILSAWVQYSNYNYIHHNQTSLLRDANGNVTWGNLNSSSNGPGTAPYAFVGGMGNEKYNQIIAASSYKHYFDENELSVLVSYMYGNDIWAGPNASATIAPSPFGGSGNLWNYTHNILNIESHFNWQVTAAHSVLFGVQEKFLNYQQNAYVMSDWRDFASAPQTQANRTDNSGGSSNFIGAFVDWRAQWLESLSTSLGVRWDLWNGFGYYKNTRTSLESAFLTSTNIADNTRNQFSPKASLNYAPISTQNLKTLFKASFGQSFRAPTFSQMFREYTRNDGVTFLGNPYLKPEVLTSYDIGFEQHFGLDSGFGGVVKLYYFDSFLNNAITILNNNYTNAQKARINGIELSYNQAFWAVLGLRLTYTWTNAKLTQNLGDIQAGNHLPNVPEHSGYAQVYYDDSRFYGSLGVEMASKQYRSLDNASQKVWGVYGASDAYYIMDMRLGLHLRHFDVSANFTNLLDYTYYAYYRAPGRAFYVEIATRI